MFLLKLTKINNIYIHYSSISIDSTLSKPLEMELHSGFACPHTAKWLGKNLLSSLSFPNHQ